MVSKWIVILAMVIGLSWLCMLGFAQEESDVDCEKLVIKKAYDKALKDFKKGKTITCDCEHCMKAGAKAKPAKLKIIGEEEGKVIRVKEGKVADHPEIIHMHEGKSGGHSKIIIRHDGKIEGHPEIIHTEDGRMILKSHGNSAHAGTEEIAVLNLADCHEEDGLLICGSEVECIDLRNGEECSEYVGLLECEECEICVECEEREACEECVECEECGEYETMLSTGDGSHYLRRVIRSEGKKGSPALLLSTLSEDEKGRRIVERRPFQARPARRAPGAAQPLATTLRRGHAPSRLEEKYDHGKEEKVEELSDQIDDLRAEVRDLHEIVKKLQKHIERMTH